MRQRQLDKNGDYQFGIRVPFMVDTPACVAQAIMTRLRLRSGEWFLDTQDGTPYDDQVLGFGTGATRDLALRTRILDTPGVVAISEYISFLDDHRDFSMIATVDTAYGPAAVAATL